MIPFRNFTCQLLNDSCSKINTASSIMTLICRRQSTYYRSLANVSTLNKRPEEREPGAAAVLKQPVRFYHKQKTIKIPPTKPLKFDYAGDLDSSLPELDKELPRLGFESIQELAEAEEEVKKIFSLEFANANDLKQKRISDLVKVVQFHPADTESIEVRIAYLTIMIRNQMKHCLEFRKDKAAKSRLVGRIQARKKYLRLLRQLDYERFEWLLKTLKIKYIPPTDRTNVNPIRRQKLKNESWADTHAKIREKLAVYKEQLAIEKEAFLKEKEQTVEEIRKDMESLDIEENSEIGEAYRKIVNRSNFI